jgi:hypothetical protein
MVAAILFALDMVFRPPSDGEWTLGIIFLRVFLWFLASLLVVWVLTGLGRTFRANPLLGTVHVMFGVFYALCAIVMLPHGPLPPFLFAQFIIGLLWARAFTAVNRRFRSL